MRAYKGDREGTVKNFLGWDSPTPKHVKLLMDMEFNRNNYVDNYYIVSSSIEQFTTPLVLGLAVRNPRNPCSMQNWKKPEGVIRQFIQSRTKPPPRSWE